MAITTSRLSMIFHVPVSVAFMFLKQKMICLTVLFYFGVKGFVSVWRRGYYSSFMDYMAGI